MLTVGLTKEDKLIDNFIDKLTFSKWMVHILYNNVIVKIFGNGLKITWNGEN